MARFLLVLTAVLTPSLALAHGGHGPAASFAAGLGHPPGGADHLLAMIAVGLWAGLAGGRAIWALPAAFVGAMLAGGMLAVRAVDLPGVEHTILASVIVIGALVALRLRVALPVAVAVVALFGLAHGHAHGSEGPAGWMAAYGAGFALSTLALHGVGLALVSRAPPRVVRGLGALTAGGGIALAVL